MLARDNVVANARSGGEGVCCLSTLDSSRYIEGGKKKGKGRKRDATARVDG